MTTEHTALTRLDSALSDALDASRGFKPLLEEELAALKAADITALNGLVQRKKTQTEALLTASQALLQWCADQRIDPDYASFEAWTQQLDPAERPARLERWRELRQSLAANDERSAINRQVLATLSNRNQAQLGLLRNLLAPTETYSADGQRDSSQPGGWVDRV